ncbi:lamin tail domain-containing protein [bacterium]|nr:lamin tail domain-containing protein [bacterium]
MSRINQVLLPAIFIILSIYIGPSQYHGVEITKAQSSSGYLILNEIGPWPSDDAVWVEIINPSSNPASLDGYTVEFLSGFSYTFPGCHSQAEASVKACGRTMTLKHLALPRYSLALNLQKAGSSY